MENLQELLDQRHAGTCRWIFDTSEFKDWQASICPNLWLHGKPGSGKSVIMATLIRHLQTNGAIAAYFFCKLGDDNQRTLESIMRTWLWQILEQMPEYTELALQHRKKSLGIHTPLDPVKDAMGEIISKCNKSIYLVVDGFDECESGPASMDKLMAFLPTLGQKTLFAIASRPENWIRKAINTQMYHKCSTIQVTNTRTEEDLGRWIQARILHMELADSKLEQLAITKLKDGADGMFLWAGFQLEAFEAQFAVEDAKAVLQNELPKDLESTYERLLTNIQESPNPLRRTRASQILQWITAANRPLTLRELDFALGIQIDSNVPPQQRSLMRGESDVLEACGSFVEITKTGHIRFVHASAKEFLSSKRVQFGLGLAQSHSKDPLQKALDAMHIARACITCLSLSDVGLDCTRPSKSSSIRSIKNFLAEYPFFEYAALNWWKHLNFLPYADEGLLKMTVSRFLGSSENTVRWLQLYQYLNQFHAAGNLFSSSDDPSCWVYVRDFWNAHLGPNSTNLFNRFHRWHTEMWFDRGILWPPTHIAAFFNFEDIIIRQLQHGFSVDHRNALAFTPLLQAAHGDSPDAARALIDHGANICAQTRYGYDAIRYACRNSLSTFSLLLQAGARAGIADRSNGFTALHEIASSVLWHPQILHTLLSFAYISDIINREDLQGNLPLDYASAIDVHVSASSLYQESFLGSEDPEAQFSRDKLLISISSMFSAQGPQALHMLHKGWLDLGVYTTIDSTFESVLGAVTVWKAQMIRKLVQKGAISALDTQQSKHR